MGLFNRKEKRAAGDAIINTPTTGATGISYQGIFGTQQNALQLSTVFRCIEIISESIAVLPIGVYTKNGVRVNHSLDIVWRDTNNKLTKFEILKQLVQSVLIKGNGFIFIERNEDGSAKRLRWLESGDVNIFYEKQSNLLYYTSPIISAKKIEPINMIHLKMFSYDGINGISILSIGNKAFKLGNTLENNAFNFFANGCNLSGVLSVASSLTPQQIKDIHKAWDESYVNGSGVAVLQGNMNYQSVSNSAKENELLESREYTVKDICRWFGINPILLGLNSGSTYASLEMAQNDFVIHTLLPWIEAIEEEFSRKLLKPSEQNDLEVVLDENYLLRMDKKTEATYYSTMVNNGLMTRNEARGKLGLEPVEGGDKLVVPFTDINQNTINNDEK